MRLAGLRLRAIREFLAMSATEFAQSYGSKLSAHANRESGARYPGIGPALQIRKAYGVGLDWIYAGDENDLPEMLRKGIVARYIQILAEAFDIEPDAVRRILSRRQGH